MKFCTKCGNGIDVSKKFCTNCGSPNIYYSNAPTPLLQNEALQAEELRRKTVLEEQIALEQAKKEAERLESLRLEQERLEIVRIENERLESIRLENERQQREEKERQRLLEEAEKKKLEEAQILRMYEVEKQDILITIKQEREQLKSQLEEIARLKDSVNTITPDIPAPRKSSAAKKILTVTFILLLLGALSAGGYYVYTVYINKSSFDLAQDAIAKQEWLTASGHLSQAIKEYEQNKLHLSAEEINSARKWQQAVQQFSVAVRAISNAIGKPYKATEYKSITARIAKVDFNDLAATKLPKADAYRSANAVAILVDSFRLLSIEQFVSEGVGVKLNDNGLIYTQQYVSLNIDTELTYINNKESTTIAPIYERVLTLVNTMHENAKPANATPAAKQRVVRNIQAAATNQTSQPETDDADLPAERDID